MFRPEARHLWFLLLALFSLRGLLGILGGLLPAGRRRRQVWTLLDALLYLLPLPVALWMGWAPAHLLGLTPPRLPEGVLVGLVLGLLLLAPFGRPRPAALPSALGRAFLREGVWAALRLPGLLLWGAVGGFWAGLAGAFLWAALGGRSSFRREAPLALGSALLFALWGSLPANLLTHALFVWGWEGEEAPEPDPALPAWSALWLLAVQAGLLWVGLQQAFWTPPPTPTPVAALPTPTPIPVVTPTPFFTPTPTPTPLPTATPTPTPRPYLEHVVARGESLYTIARRYGTTVRELVEFNELEDPDFLRVGQVIRIPLDAITVPLTPTPEAP